MRKWLLLGFVMSVGAVYSAVLWNAYFYSFGRYDYDVDSDNYNNYYYYLGADNSTNMYWAKVGFLHQAGMGTGYMYAWFSPTADDFQVNTDRNYDVHSCFDSTRSIVNNHYTGYDTARGRYGLFLCEKVDEDTYDIIADAYTGYYTASGSDNELYLSIWDCPLDNDKTYAVAQFVEAYCYAGDATNTRVEANMSGHWDFIVVEPS